jgi:hypothetical protein
MPNFILPEGVEVPENLKEGEKFQTMATIVLKKNGKAMLVEVDGQPIAGYEGKKGKEVVEEEEVVEEGAASGKEGFIAEVMQRGRGPIA